MRSARERAACCARRGSARDQCGRSEPLRVVAASDRGARRARGAARAAAEGQRRQMRVAAAASRQAVAGALSRRAPIESASLKLAAVEFRDMASPLRSGTDCAAWRELETLAQQARVPRRRASCSRSDPQRFEHCSRRGARDWRSTIRASASMRASSTASVTLADQLESALAHRGHVSRRCHQQHRESRGTAHGAAPLG